MPARRYVVSPQGGGQASSTGQVKWHPGHYTQSNQVVSVYRGAQWAARKAEIDLVLTQANVAGYMDIHLWASIEDVTAGVYNWANIDQARDYIRATYPTKRYGVMIWAEEFDHADPGGCVPTYILNNPGTYGAGYDGVRGGYWQLTDNVSAFYATAALWRTSVYNRFIALFQALATHQSAGMASAGIANYDTDPYFEAVTQQEISLSISSGSDLTVVNQSASWGAINTAMVAAFPHTNVISQFNYGITQAETASIVSSDYTRRCSGGSPDIYGPYGTLSSLTWGQQAQIGYAPAGAVDLRGKMPYDAFVQQPDYGFDTVRDMCNVSLLTMQAARIWWMILQGGVGTTGDFMTQVLPVINSNPVPNLNQVCPTSYVNVGGCNTA